MPPRLNVPMTLEERFERQAQISDSSLLSPSDAPASPLDSPTQSLSWDFDPETNSGSRAGRGKTTAHAIGQDHNIIGALPRQGENTSVDPLEIISTVWKDQKLRDDLCNLKGPDAQLIIDYLYSVLLNPVLPEPWLRRHCIIALYKLSKASQLYPHCYTLKESIVPGSQQSANGAFSDILKGRFGDRELCFKLIRLYKADLQSMLKIYAKEAILWGQLNHPNVAPFYGIYYLDQNREHVCLVSPWMRYGNLVEYLKNRPSSPRALFVYDVVAGLSYLHELGLIHSDLKGANILVNDIEQACITDFGASFIRTDKTLAQAIGTSTTYGFSQRWAAPELLDDDACPTIATDIWALGCVCLEILTGKLPYHGMRDLHVIRALMKGKPPTRPTSFTSQNDDIIWKEVDRCWMINPEERPRCQDIFLKLKRAGISRGEKGEAQHDAEQEIQKFRDELRTKREDPVDLEAVRRLLKSLQGQNV